MTKILAPSLCALLAASAVACSNEPTAPSANAPPARVTTAGAARVHGDLMPAQLAKLSIPSPTEMTLIRGSDALAPYHAFALETPAPTVSGRDFHRTFTGLDPAGLTFPIDNPSGARVLVRTSDGTPLASVHMHSVATGARLDHARDPKNTQHVTRPGGLDPAVAREPGFASLLDSRTLAFDEATAPGLVALDLPADAAAHGIVLEVQQPNTRIALSGSVDELAHGLGETAVLKFSVADGGAPVDGATVTGWTELPGHIHAPDFTFTSLGNGQYSATVPLATATNIGVWGIHVRATGQSNGVAFERDVETAFGFYPSHARMTAFGTPQISRGSDGLVDEVSVDVDIETLADDRFGVRGTLTYDAPDGTEHPLASAQTGQTVNAGKGTITLHFGSDAMALARVDGPFHLRDVALVSYAFGVTQHRIGRALDLTTRPIGRDEIRYPTVIPLGAQDLMANGDLPQVRQ